MAFLSPDLFGIVVGYSAALNSFDAGLTSDIEYPNGMAEMWVPAPAGQDLIRTEPRKPIRIFHSATENDFGAEGSCFQTDDGYVIPADMGTATEYMDFLEANNRTEEALTEKGYETRYAYGLGACHCQSDMILEDLPNSLVWAWAEWKKKKGDDHSGNEDDDDGKDESKTDTSCRPCGRRLLFGPSLTGHGLPCC